MSNSKHARKGLKNTWDTYWAKQHESLYFILLIYLGLNGIISKMQLKIISCIKKLKIRFQNVNISLKS